MGDRKIPEGCAAERAGVGAAWLAAGGGCVFVDKNPEQPCLINRLVSAPLGSGEPLDPDEVVGQFGHDDDVVPFAEHVHAVYVGTAEMGQVHGLANRGGDALGEKLQVVSFRHGVAQRVARVVHDLAKLVAGVRHQIGKRLGARFEFEAVSRLHVLPRCGDPKV